MLSLTRHDLVKEKERFDDKAVFVQLIKTFIVGTVDTKTKQLDQARANFCVYCQYNLRLMH